MAAIDENLDQSDLEDEAWSILGDSPELRYFHATGCWPDDGEDDNLPLPPER